MLAEVLESDVELPLRVLLNAGRHADAAGRRNSLQTCCDIHSVAKNVTVVDDDVAHVDPNAEIDPLLLGYVDVAFGHAALDIHGAAHCVHNAAEFGQHPITGVLDDPAAVLGDLGIDQGPQVILEAGVRPFFVQAGQPTVTSDISRDNGREPSL